MSGSIRRGLTFTFRAAFGALWLVAGCGELLGIEDPPAPSECVKAADCGPGRTCVEWKCVDVCRGGACAGSGGEAGHTVSAGTGGDSAGEGGRAASGGTTSAGGDAGEGVSGRGGESGAGGGASGSGGVGGGAAGVPHTGGEAGEPTAGGSGGDGGEPPGPTGCVPGDSRCFVCEDGRYVAGTQCRQGACTEASGCINPRSCSGSTTRCGANESCCKSLPVPGGSFLRSCDAYCQACDATPRDYPASVGDFALDAFEVTVSRFRAFVVQYSGVKPADGSGKNPRNPADDGWRSEWDAFLPDTRQALETAISDDPAVEDDVCGLATWTAEPGINEAKPISCVSFYLAYAFCIWDGGRLPTEAEWNYAASGGAEQRVYPWSSPPDSPQIGVERAVFGQSEDYPIGPADVGELPAGNGRFGHSDLAGNVAEWVFDDYSTCYPTPDQCSDCGYSSVDALRVLRGGSFGSSESNVLVESRAPSAVAYGFAGFRCARDI